MRVLQFADYAAPYRGNFISELTAVENEKKYISLHEYEKLEIQKKFAKIFVSKLEH